jgi:hypothetical protein
VHHLTHALVLDDTRAPVELFMGHALAMQKGF